MNLLPPLLQLELKPVSKASISCIEPLTQKADSIGLPGRKHGQSIESRATSGQANWWQIAFEKDPLMPSQTTRSH
jgi:hypothetical protein